MSARSKRQRGASEPVDTRQQDLFADYPVALKPVPPANFGGAGDPETPKPLAALPPRRMEVVRSRAPASSARARAVAPPGQAAPPVFGADDWWTTRAVCGFLKIGRKALWNMRRDPGCDFPAPVDAVGHRHLYLAAEVRAWMDAQHESACQRADQRRHARTQFAPRSS